jgi:putative transposase
MSEKYKIRDQEKPYFVTFATEGWVDVFTRQVYREIIVDALKYCQSKKGLVLYSWCLMTNHMHLIVGRSKEEKIEEIIRDLKKFTSVQICKAIETNQAESRKTWMLQIFRSAALESKKHTKFKFWQNEYHPVELSDNHMIDQKLAYIHENPVKDGIVENPEDYLYSSARDYAGVKGLLEITFLD